MAEVFHIIPATARWSWVFLLALPLLVGVGALALVGLSLKGSRTSTFEVRSDGLHVRGDLYGRKVPASQLRGGAARVVDLDQETSLRPRGKTMGTAMPGYRSGWFKLANGEKALLYLTDMRRAVYVPTRAGYSLLLSVDRPKEFLEQLRAIAPAS
jgi:hypothetical protein